MFMNRRHERCRVMIQGLEKRLFIQMRLTPHHFKLAVLIMLIRLFVFWRFSFVLLFFLPNLQHTFALAGGRVCAAGTDWGCWKTGEPCHWRPLAGNLLNKGAQKPQHWDSPTWMASAIYLLLWCILFCTSPIYSFRVQQNEISSFVCSFWKLQRIILKHQMPHAMYAQWLKM